MAAKYADSAQWQEFARQESLTTAQRDQLYHYYTLLIDWNMKINLTSITVEQDIIAYHFQDSLSFAKKISPQNISSIADVGSGAGFPGLPLKIVYPHLFVVLIETSGKRVRFLNQVIRELGLNNIEVNSLDWRTFLRKTDYDINYFCARASLSMTELLAMYRPSCQYRSSGLVYWASESWEPTQEAKKMAKEVYHYAVGVKKRKLVVFSCIECII